MTGAAASSPRATAPLNGTFDADGHVYRDAKGNRVPSVTQILKRTGLVSYDQVQADILENRRNLGEIVHRDTQELDTGELSFSATRKDAQPYVNAWKKFKRECNVQILESEVAEVVAYNAMPFGMTTDRHAIVNGREAVLEIKTSKAREHWWGLQLAGYDLGMGQCPAQLYRDRYVIQLREDETYRMWKYDDENDYHAFQWALALTYWMLNRRYSID
jgi:hypothetical protein